MGSLFESIKTGLEQAIEYEQGKGPARVTTYHFSPVKKYTNAEVRHLRQHAGMTQSVFASYMGVSKKTVEAWENGRTHPTGSACRLLDILSAGMMYSLPFVTKTG